jgi:hypothetical protein
MFHKLRLWLRSKFRRFKQWLQPDRSRTQLPSRRESNYASRPKPELRSHVALESLLTNLENVVDSAITSAEDINTDGLSNLLSLVSTVILQIQNVFSNILSTLVRIKYLDFTNDENIEASLHEFERYRYDYRLRRDRYFCHRLRELCESYESLVIPELLKANISNLDEWLQTFLEVDSVRFSYLRIEKMASQEILALISEARSSQEFREDKYRLVREKAAEYIEILNNYLYDLQNLNNRILGLSGRAGFLQLVSDPDRLKQTHISLVRGVTMTNEAPKYDMRGANFPGGFAETNHGKMVETQNNYPSEQRQTLAEAATEIQQLLKQLEQTNPTATESERIAYVNDETTPSFKRRVVGALQAGGEAAIEEFLDNPYVNVGKATVKGWMQPE